MPIYENRPSKINFFGVNKFLFMNFAFKNWFLNDFKDKKRAADLKKRVSHKIDFKVLWPRNDHADSLVDKFIKMIKTLTCVGAILISTKKISKIFPKNVVSSQNDWTTDFIDLGAWV